MRTYIHTGLPSGDPRREPSAVVCAVPRRAVTVSAQSYSSLLLLLSRPGRALPPAAPRPRRGARRRALWDRGQGREPRDVPALGAPDDGRRAMTAFSLTAQGPPTGTGRTHILYCVVRGTRTSQAQEERVQTRRARGTVGG